MPTALQPQYDFAIIGAGLTGMNQMYQLRSIGATVRVFEAGEDVGGTWHWNRYPGCTLDSESFTYGYAFAKDMLQDWNWSKRYASQPEVLSYFREFADRYDIRKDVEFNTRILSARYDERHNLWELEKDNGEVATARFVITAVGLLSEPLDPPIPGKGDFKGEAYNTSSWPRDPDGLGGLPGISFAGKRVAVIGTGSTGIQVIQEVAKTADELVVLQRDASWAFPLGNESLDAEKMAEIRSRYEEIFATCDMSPGGFYCLPQMTSALDVTPEERRTQFEALYEESGFGLWLGNYHDVLAPGEANRLLGEFVAEKIRQRVNDPAVADVLIPKDHVFGSRRVPLETNYYEVYNQDNVRLVDLMKTPIMRINDEGVELSSGQVDLDMIVYATGFKAVRGAIDRIEIVGRNGEKLSAKWQDRPVTYLGVQSSGFPNFFMQLGPYHGATFCNIPRCVEHSVTWLTELFRRAREQDVDYIEATPEAEIKWTDQVAEEAAQSLFMTTDSFITGSNAAGAARTFLFYASGNPTYRQIISEIAADNYAGFAMLKAEAPDARPSPSGGLMGAVQTPDH
ncbi:NAD(P)/FAD-dependent oxidoreductase [Sphingobium sp.]|uniref:flavin-containing monooxygenase n=1 Tax=Sphingobium sp. TaxID=1912891 RepID=UPI0028BEAE06|nr:NAD(P)/FAD-dependent oxidoreductase [Sphingobium sp.]